MILLLMAAFLVSCGTDDYRTPPPRLTPISHVDGLREEDNNTVGLCFVKDGHKQIIIYDGKWLELLPEQQELVIYHERGHCDYNQEHNNALLEDSCPVSLMNWQVPTIPCADAHINDYRREWQKGWTQ